MLEVSLTLTLFLAIIFFLMYSGLWLNARVAVIHGVGEGLRFGITRGDLGSVPALEAYRGVAGSSGDISLAHKLLYYRGRSATENADDFKADFVENFALRLFTNPLGTPSFAKGKLPAQYLYALAAVHQEMRTRIGTAMLRYPCNGEANCLGCFFLNPKSALDPTVSPYKELESTDIVDPDVIGMECTYYADFGIMSLLGSLLHGKREPFPIRRTFFASRSHDT